MTHFERELDASQHLSVELDSEDGWLYLFTENDVISLDPRAMLELYAFLDAHKDVLKQWEATLARRDRP